MKDLSGFERGTTSVSHRLSPMVKAFTTFYTYFNAKLNLAYESTKRTDFKKPGDVAHLAADYLLLFWVEAVVAELILQRVPDFDDDDEDPIMWNVLRTLENIASMIPIVKEAAGVVRGFDSAPGGMRGISVLGEAIGVVGRGGVDFFTDDDEVNWFRITRSLTSAAFIFRKLPGGAQLNQVLRAMEEEAKGEDVAPIDYLLYREGK